MREMEHRDPLETTQRQIRPQPAATSLANLFTFNQQTLLRVTGLLELGFVVLEGLIGLRFLLRMIGSNLGTPFASFIYAITYPFLYPFIGLTRVITVQGMVLEFYDLVAMLVYGLVAWVVIRLVWLAFAQIRP